MANSTTIIKSTLYKFFSLRCNKVSLMKSSGYLVDLNKSKSFNDFYNDNTQDNYLQFMRYVGSFISDKVKTDSTESQIISFIKKNSTVVLDELIVSIFNDVEAVLYSKDDDTAILIHMIIQSGDSSITSKAFKERYRMYYKSESNFENSYNHILLATGNPIASEINKTVTDDSTPTSKVTLIHYDELIVPVITHYLSPKYEVIGNILSNSAAVIGRISAEFGTYLNDKNVFEILAHLPINDAICIHLGLQMGTIVRMIRKPFTNTDLPEVYYRIVVDERQNKNKNKK